MPQLAERPVLSQIQAYVQRLEDESGFARDGLLEKCLLLGEEVGELYEAVRRRTGLGTDPHSESPEAAGELADILIYLRAIANRLGVDLETALRVKEEANKQRSWTRQ